MSGLMCSPPMEQPMREQSPCSPYHACKILSAEGVSGDLVPLFGFFTTGDIAVPSLRVRIGSLTGTRCHVRARDRAPFSCRMQIRFLVRVCDRAALRRRAWIGSRITMCRRTRIHHRIQTCRMIPMGPRTGCAIELSISGVAGLLAGIVRGPFPEAHGDVANRWRGARHGPLSGWVLRSWRFDTCRDRPFER